MMKIEPGCTRVDLDRDEGGVTVRKWFGKWEELEPAGSVQYYPDTRVESLLMTCEKAGFTVEMRDSMTGRALRGEITRVDFTERKKGEWEVKKYPYGWTASTRPIARKVMSEAEALEMLKKYESGRWKVRRFPGGARVWKYEILPVRDASTIKRMRRQLEIYPGQVDERRMFDLAFDC